MSVKYFNKEQIEELSKNPYVQKVSEKAITYTEEFRMEFFLMYQQGNSPSSILISMGINPKILGRRRISSIVSRVKIMAEKGVFNDSRKESVGRPRAKEMTPEEEITYLKHKVEYQKQQIEALKKIQFVEKKKIWKQQKKNIKSFQK